MILQALVDYYNRKRAADPGSLAPEGWEYKEVAFFIDVCADGSAVLVDRRSPMWKRGAPMLVPAAEIRSGNDAWKKPNLLWDHMGFVLGRQKQLADGSPDPADKPDKVSRQHGMFMQRVRALVSQHPEAVGLRAVGTFYERYEGQPIEPLALWADLVSGAGLNLTFRLMGAVEPVCQEPWAELALAATAEPAEPAEASLVQPCLVTGGKAPVARLHPKISGVTAKPGPLVSANTNESPAYSSYGKQQALTAPVSTVAAAQYAAALNRLLAKDSTSKLRIGDAVAVVWADRDTTLDAALVAMLGGDDPDAAIESVRRRLDGARLGGAGADDTNLRFFVLGLAPNVARIAVRFWLHEPFHRLGQRIVQHFDDLRIAHRSHGPAALSMFRLLLATAPQSKAENVLPNLAGEWLRAILEGQPYPRTLLNAVINRCRAEQGTKEQEGNVTHARAAILKACINRERRHRHCQGGTLALIGEELDVNQTDPAYRLGRLFAVLERIQEQAARPSRLNATIRDRYYGAASSVPATVFPTLLRLKNAHAKKLAGAEAGYFERLLGAICGTVEAPMLGEFPRQLDLHAQGLFALGYYQQRQSFFTPRADHTSAQDAANETTQED